MKKTNTKRTLILSALSLLLCFSMLIGTTFAWFTDEVSSKNNIIKAGNLDVALYYQDEAMAEKDEWDAVDADTNVFIENALWEPGHTEVVKLKVVNEGTLALKYQLGINVDSEIESVNVNNETIKLSNYIKYAVVDGYTGYDRDSAIAEAEQFGANALSKAYDSGVITLAPAAEKIVTMVVYMPEAVGNVANAKKGANVPTINLGINLFATQLSAETEKDSFGPDYDEEAVWADAYVTDAASLNNAIANAKDGDTIALLEDIVLTDNSRAAAANFAFAVAKGKNVVINLNGKTITKVNSTSDINGDGKFTSADNQGVFQVQGNLTVIGEGTITMENTGVDMEWNALSAVFSVEGGTLTLGEGVTIVHKGGTAMAYAVDVNTTLGESVLNVNGAVLHSTYTGVRVFNNNKTQKGIVNYNSGLISGTNRDVWTQIMSAPAENAILNTEIPYTTNQAGDRYYFDTAVASDTAGLKAELENGSKDIYLVAGEYTFPSSALTADTVLNCAEGTVFTGNSKLNINGATVVGATFSNPNGAAADQTINGVFENCVFEGANGLRWCYAGETVIFNNCVFSGSTYGVHFDGGATKVVFNDCTFSGFNAMAGSIELAEYNGCTFVANGVSNYNGINMWGNTKMTDCTFVFDGTAGYEWIDLCGANKTASFTNCVVTDGTTTTDILGVVSKREANATIIVDGDIIIPNQEEAAAYLTAALAKDIDVVLAGDITFTGVKSMPDRNNYVEAYGNKTGFAQYNGVLDGNGKTITDAEGDKSYVIVTHGGTIKNLTIKSGARGIVTYSPTANVIIDNVVVDGAGYALNSTEHAAVDMIVTNSTINGWTSLAGFNKVEFTNCKLGENSLKYWQKMGYDQDYDRLFRVYSPTFFTECEFEQGYYLDMTAGGTATLKACTVNGVVITAENYDDYITVELPAGKTLSDCVTFAQ